ncbi:hypothetical protein PSY81_23580, partial [Shigella flexneri]|nr:hypothetical protein [Shigella flexneri]
DHQPDMVASKSTSTDHHRADDPIGSNDVDEGLAAGTHGFKYNPWILSFSEELLRGARSKSKV